MRSVEANARYWSTEDHDAKQLAEVIADFAKWARSRAVAQ